MQREERRRPPTYPTQPRDSSFKADTCGCANVSATTTMLTQYKDAYSSSLPRCLSSEYHYLTARYQMYPSASTLVPDGLTFNQSACQTKPSPHRQHQPITFMCKRQRRDKPNFGSIFDGCTRPNSLEMLLTSHFHAQSSHYRES